MPLFGGDKFRDDHRGKLPIVMLLIESVQIIQLAFTGMFRAELVS